MIHSCVVPDVIHEHRDVSEVSDPEAIRSFPNRSFPVLTILEGLSLRILKEVQRNQKSGGVMVQGGRRHLVVRPCPFWVSWKA